MKSNARILGALVAGVSAWLLMSYSQRAMKQQKLKARQFSKEAVAVWEDEGGTIVDPKARAAAA
ncbi:MAG: hypothetical protein ABL931_05520 [Usitatibacteraceae bacterium]